MKKFLVQATVLALHSLQYALVTCHFLPNVQVLRERDYYNSAESEFPVCEIKDELIPHIHCFLYYICNDSVPTLNLCDHSLYFNRVTGKCDQKENVDDCVEGVRVLPGQTFPSSLKNMFKVAASPPFADPDIGTNSLGIPDYTEPELAQSKIVAPSTTKRPTTVGSFEEATQILFPEFVQVLPTTTESIEVTKKPRKEKKTTTKTTTKATTIKAVTTKPTTTTAIPSMTLDVTTGAPISRMSLPMTLTSTVTVDRGCNPSKIVVHHYPGPCRAEFTCSDGTSFVIQHCMSNLIWRPKHIDIPAS